MCPLVSDFIVPHSERFHKVLLCGKFHTSKNRLNIKYIYLRHFEFELCASELPISILKQNKLVLSFVIVVVVGVSIESLRFLRVSCACVRV